MKYVLIILLPSMALAQDQIQDAKKSIMSLIRPLMAGSTNKRPHGTEKFRVDGCEKKKIDWMGVLMMRETANLNFKFQEGCDIEGTITPKVFQPFPANLNIRNIQSYSKIETMNKVTANLETKPILNLEMREGILSGKASKVKFEADYGVRISPVADKVVQENLGGELRISEINGKKVNIKEKIFVDQK
jgi:hypothetical protein